MEERCGHALLECAAGTSDDGAYHPQKLELCIMALEYETCSAIFEQRVALHGKKWRRGQSHPALRRAAGPATPPAVFQASPTAGPDPPLAGPKTAAVQAFGAGPRPLALAGGNATLWIAVVVVFRLIRRWCLGHPGSGYPGGGVSRAERASPRATVASAAENTDGIDSSPPAAAVPFAGGFAGGEVGTGSDQSRVGLGAAGPSCLQ